MVSDLQAHLETEYINLMIEDENTKPLKRGINPENAAEWLDPFKNLSTDDQPKQRGPPGGHRAPAAH